MRTRISALALALPLALFFGAGSAAAFSLKVDYVVSLRGFPVGRARLHAEVADGRYTTQLKGGVSGLARLFSSISVEATATGTLGDDRPLAQDYSHVWTEDNDTETVSMRFSGRGVAAIDLEPPQSHPERYIPMTAKDEADALDLVSAFLWPAPAGSAPGICARTLPLIDGKRRFDIDFTYERSESFAMRGGSHQRRAVVCAIHYRPISGHRIDNKPEGFLGTGDGMEVWLAAAGDGLAIPVKVQLGSKLGQVILQATAIETQ